MGVCNPESSVIHYRLDEEVGTALNVVAPDEEAAEYRLQLLAKSGKAISEVSLEEPLSSVSTLQKDLTIGISVGGLGAGTVLKEGTTLEEIIERIFAAPTFYWGFIGGKGSEEIEDLPAEDIFRPTVPASEARCPIEFVPTDAKGAFVLILPDPVNVLDSFYLQSEFQTIDGLNRSAGYGAWKASGIVKDAGETKNWRVLKNLSIDGHAYVAYGLYKSDWHTDEVPADNGTIDKITIGFLPRVEERKPTVE